MYLAGGLRILIRSKEWLELNGVDNQKITSVHNAIDAHELKQFRSEVEKVEIVNTRGQIGLNCLAGDLIQVVIGSYSASAVVGFIISLHHVFGTWSRKVNMYNAPTRFSEVYLSDLVFSFVTFDKK